MTEWDGSTYLTASAWARDHWTDVQVPYRLHERGFDAGGAPEMSGAFLRFIQARAQHTMLAIEVVPCRHITVDTQGCLDCGVRDEKGNLLYLKGFFEKRVEHFRYPMAAALARLDNDQPVPKTWDPHNKPTYAQTILLLSRHAWDLAGTSLSLNMAYEMFEALALLSLRKLHSRYAVRPIAKVGWVSMSDAQRSAEAMA